jgi:hypothetical protein
MKQTALKRGKKKGAKKNKTNPHGVNQYTGPDPRQSLFLVNYLDPQSETFSNALQSALKAGFSQQYAESIMSLMPEWLSEKLGDSRRIQQAERHLDQVLELPILIPAMGAFGPIVKKIPTGKYKTITKKGKKKRVEIFEEEPIMVWSTSLIKEKSKVAEFALSGLARSRYGKDGGGKSPGVVVPVQINIHEDREKYA